MNKLFSLLVIAVIGLVITSSAYAIVESETGPQMITTCFATGTDPMTSGNVVVLQTTSPTYWGREVTGSTTRGNPIYGVVVDGTNYSGAEMASGKWIRVQTYGYCPLVRLSNGVSVTVNASHLVTSALAMRADSHNDIPSGSWTNMITGNVVALETQHANNQNMTIKALLK